MVGQVQVAFLLIIAVFARNDAAPFVEEQVSEPFEHSVNLDDQFDLQLPHLRSFILENGLDPMDMTDISDYLLPDMPGRLKGQIDLTKGWMQNLSQIKRVGHVIAKYTSEKLIILDMDLGFDVMDFNYAYHVKFLLLNREGELYGRLYNLKTKVLVTVDLNEYHVHLDSIKFTEVGKCDIKFEGHLADSILNAATKVVVWMFKKPVLTHIEQRAMEILGAKMDEWDKLIPRPNSTEPTDNVVNIDTFDIKINTLEL